MILIYYYYASSSNIIIVCKSCMAFTVRGVYPKYKGENSKECTEAVS